MGSEIGDRRSIFGEWKIGGMHLRVDNRIRIYEASAEERERFTTLCTHDNPARASLSALEGELRKRPHDKRLYGQVMRMRQEPVRFTLARTESDGSISLPRGLWSRLPLGGCRNVEDQRSKGSLGSPKWGAPKKTPRDYQAPALQAMMLKQQGILRFPAGSGKTFLLLECARRIGLPTICIVPTQALLEQWIAVAIADFGLPAEEIGVIGNGVDRVREITFATVDSLAANEGGRAKRCANDFGVLLFDEIYSAPARTRFAVVDCFAARYRFGAGDDERRKDDLEALTYDLFGEVIAEAKRRDLEKKGAIMPVRVRLVETGVEPPKWWTKLSPLARSNRYTELIRYLEDDVQRAALIAALVNRSAREGQVLVFAHHVDHVQRVHADSLAASPYIEESTSFTGDLRGATGYFLGGDKMKSERQETTTRLLEGTCRAAFATYKALGKGINLPAVERAVLTTPIHGNKDGVNQVLARLNRTSEGKAQPEAVVLYDEKVFGVSPVRKFQAGGREVVVEMRDGSVIPAKEYLSDRDERKAGGEASSFFDGLR